MNQPRLMLAGANSNAGKTTVSLALMAALAARGLAVAPFKAGPDYIDPSLHRAAAQRPCHNLDVWLCGEQGASGIFRRYAAEGPDGVSIIEGVMGLFDGLGGGAYAGSAHVAALTRSPVVLVFDARGLSLSAAALASGFAAFRPRGGPDLEGLRVAGVICTRVSGEAHAALVREAVEGHSSLTFFGALPEGAAPPLPERHLGLVPATELENTPALMAALARAAEEHLDIPALLRLARSAPAQTATEQAATEPRLAKRPRIGLALDAAFSFYYDDSLEALREAGAELVPFSPLADARLPDGLRGLYFGGGFPEMFAERLAANAAMREQVRGALERGLPALAECGGLLYLCESLAPYGPDEDADAPALPMCGFLPRRARMGKSLRRPFGYLELELLRDCPLGPAGSRLKAHEFHYSLLEEDPPEENRPEKNRKDGPLYRARKPDGRVFEGGFLRMNVAALYPHLHFRGLPLAAGAFVSACRAFE